MCRRTEHNTGRGSQQQCLVTVLRHHRRSRELLLGQAAMHASSPTGFCQQHQHTVSALARASRHNVVSWDTGSQPQPLNAGACSTNTSDIRSSWPPPSTSLLLQAGKLQPHAAMPPPSLTQLSTTFARHTTMIEKQSVSGHWPENILQVYHCYTILKNCKCNIIHCES